MVKTLSVAVPMVKTLSAVHSPLDPKNVQKAEGYKFGDGHKATSGLVFDKALETQLIKNAMDTWGMSSRCCTHSGDKCGMVIINAKGSGHCKNILFEKCRQHGGNGHENLVMDYLPKGGKIEKGVLLYGYSIQNGQFRFNSGTFHGTSAPDGLGNVIKIVHADLSKAGAGTVVKRKIR